MAVQLFLLVVLLLGLSLIQFGVLAKHQVLIQDLFLPFTILLSIILFIGIPLIALWRKPKQK
jgi:hypothetical protein